MYVYATPKYCENLHSLVTGAPGEHLAQIHNACKYKKIWRTKQRTFLRSVDQSRPRIQKGSAHCYTTDMIFLCGVKNRVEFFLDSGENIVGKGENAA